MRILILMVILLSFIAVAHGQYGDPLVNYYRWNSGGAALPVYGYSPYCRPYYGYRYSGNPRNPGFYGYNTWSPTYGGWGWTR